MPHHRILLTMAAFLFGIASLTAQAAAAEEDAAAGGAGVAPVAAAGVEVFLHRCYDPTTQQYQIVNSLGRFTTEDLLDNALRIYLAGNGLRNLLRINYGRDPHDPEQIKSFAEAYAGAVATGNLMHITLICSSNV